MREIIKTTLLVITLIPLYLFLTLIAGLILCWLCWSPIILTLAPESFIEFTKQWFSLSWF